MFRVCVYFIAWLRPSLIIIEFSTTGLVLYCMKLIVERYSWFQCCAHTLIFRHDSTVMIRPSRFDREVTKQYSILPWISYRNQSTQSESYFNNSWNVSLVIQKKRTVIHDLFSFSDNSLSYKSRNLIAIHVIGRVDVSIISISFSALFSTFFGLLPWS